MNTKDGQLVTKGYLPNNIGMITRICFETGFGGAQVILEGESVLIMYYWEEGYTYPITPIRLATREECIAYINEKHVKINKE